MSHGNVEVTTGNRRFFFFPKCLVSVINGPELLGGINMLKHFVAIFH